MSQTKTAAATLGTTRRKNTSTGVIQGSGGNRRLYIGRSGSNDYRAYLKFATGPTDTSFWSGVGQIVSAILTLYTDDGAGSQGVFVNPTDSPYVLVRRLFANFTEGTNDTVFTTADATDPASTSSGQIVVHPSAGVLEAIQIDVTGLIEAMAPATVKRRSGEPGGKSTNHGLMFFGSTDAKQNWAAISEDAESELDAYKPVLTLTYEYGLTVPSVPTNLSPAGAVASIGSFQGDFIDIKTDDQLRYSEVEVYTVELAGTAATSDIVSVADHGLQDGDQVYFTSLTAGVGLTAFSRYYVRDRTATTFKVALTTAGAAVDITTLYTALKIARLVYGVKQSESNTAITNARFDHVAADLHLVRNVTYNWRARVYDNEGQVSAYSALVAFSVTNTDPADPVLSPATGYSRASLDGVTFSGGTFSDPDGDALLAYQVQLSAYPSGDPNWDDDSFILWNTGKRYVASGSTSWSTPYGGDSLDAGTYYWRARHWDVQQGVSGWVYASIILTADFIPDPNDSTNAIQLRPRAPWRIIIRDMYQADGVTRTVGRGPGRIVAVLEDATNVGASMLYNSPGEAHWTLGLNHPQMSVIEPKQTHYAIEFRQGDGWREVFAGLVDDFDASDRDVIFYGKDYLALLDSAVDEHYDPAQPELPAEKGGSKYVTAGKNSIAYIVTDQLKRAREYANSPVGFIATGAIGTMTETLPMYSTYAVALPFIAGLLDSHRAGTGKRTRLWCHKTTLGGYEWVVTDDPGIVRDNLRLRYGELVQGYRVIPFGTGWASRVAGIGRDKDGVLVRYKTLAGPGIDESVWGRWVQPQFFDGVSDANDLERKVRQAAIAASTLGKQVGLGLRSGVLQPRDGYDLCDQFPVDIEHGAVSTSAFGSGYWVAVGITWVAPQQGSMNTILSLAPREDGTAPSADLLTLQPISRQAEWQVGWTPPDPLAASSRYWLDQSTGIVYIRESGALIVDGITGTA